MVDNYIFDLGQVLFRFVEGDMTAAFFDDPSEIETVQEVVFDRIYWDRLDNGTITDGEVVEHIKDRLPPAYRERAVSVYDHWFELIPQTTGMAELLDEIKAAGKKLYLLSNISGRFADEWRTVPHIKEMLDKFDGLVFSAPIHLTKPGVGIYRYLLQKYDLKAEDCAFIDDSEVNLITAKRMGIDTFRFTGDIDALRRFVFEKR